MTEAQVPAELAGSRLDRAVAQLAGISRSRARAALEGGAVTLDGAVVTQPARKVAEGSCLGMEIAESRDSGPPDLVPVERPLSIAYEDEHLLVVDKPAGLVVHPGAGGEADSLAAALLAHVGASLRAAAPDEAPERPGIVHRLDRDTSGLLVVAKTPEIRETLQQMLQARQLQRRYTALVWGVPSPPSGTIDKPLGRDPQQRQRRAVRADGRSAVTHYRLHRRLAGGAAAQLACTLETGRTHQVRVHLAALGHPAIGDRLYGRRKAPKGYSGAARALGRQALHAERLAFAHPATGAWLDLASPLPADLQALLAALTA